MGGNKRAEVGESRARRDTGGNNGWGRERGEWKERETVVGMHVWVWRCGGGMRNAWQRKGIEWRCVG